MNILLVTNDINQVGGIERVISRLSNYFISQLGYNVTLLSLHSTQSNNFFELNKNVNIKHLGIKQNGNLSIKNRIYKNREITKKIFNFISNKNYNIIITFHPGVSSCVLANKKNIKSKVIVTEHSDYKFYSKKRSMMNILTFKKADRLVVLTQDAKNFYSKYIRNVTVIPNTIPFTSESISENNKKRILSVGRLEDVKGFDLLIDAFKIVCENNNEWELNIIGEGGKKLELQNKIKDLKLENKVNILPFINNIKEEYLKSSIYALSSRSEAFGLVLVEAMECGLPVVSFDISCAKEILTDGEDSLIAKNFDVQDFANKLLELMNNNIDRVEYARNAKRNVQRYNMNNIGHKWKVLLESIIC